MATAICPMDKARAVSESFLSPQFLRPGEATYTMLDITDTSSAPPGLDVRAVEGCPELLAVVTPGLYAQNPFRQLGLPVLGTARDMTRRVDQLKLLAELGAGAPEWSFAPEKSPDVAQLRSATQCLKEPAVRLVHELFWFWPENYPEGPASDAALDHLACGETAQALELWQGAATLGRVAALHNLAVYYHRQALELEWQETPPEKELIQLWFKALRFWERIGAEEELWSRLRARVAGLADARVTEGFVVQMRATLPEALAKLCAALALHHGAEGRGNRASLHAALVTHIHGDTAGARRALETCAAPVARRIDARVTEMEVRAGSAGVSRLDEVVELLRQCDEDLRLIEMLCGRSSDYYGEVSHEVADAALDGLVNHQRETRDDRSCLPGLIHLLDMEMTPELKNRLVETFDAVFGNALAATLPVVDGSGSEPVKAAVAEGARSLQLIAEAIVSGLGRLGLGEASRLQYASRTAGLLKAIAITACLEHDDLELALRAFAVAFELPLSVELRESLEVDRAQLQMDFEVRREKELRVEGEGHVLLVNRHGICLDGQWVSPAEVAAVRFGVLPAAWPGGPRSFIIGWRSASGGEFELGEANLLPASTYVQEHYKRILDSIYFFLIPALVDRLAQTIRAGGEVALGATPLRADGMRLGPPARFWRGDVPVSYTRLETRVEEGRLIVSSVDNPRLSETYDVAYTWNAAIFRSIVDALARE